MRARIASAGDVPEQALAVTVGIDGVEPRLNIGDPVDRLPDHVACSAVVG
jgi:hypothetical protein